MKIQDAIIPIFISVPVISSTLRSWLFTGSGGKTGVGLLASIPARGVTQCTVECYMLDGCVYAGFETATGQCFLHDGNMSTIVLPAATASNTVSYYSRSCTRTSNTFGPYIHAVGGCVQSGKGEQTFYDANQDCLGQGAHLPYPTTQAQLEYFLTWLNIVKKPLWIGAERDKNDTNVWHWLTGEVITNNNGGQFWMSNRPTRNLDKSCAYMVNRTQTGEYGFRDKECHLVWKYLCVKDLD